MKLRYFFLSLLLHAIVVAGLSSKKHLTQTTVPTEFDLQLVSTKTSASSVAGSGLFQNKKKARRTSKPINFGISSRPQTAEILRALDQNQQSQADASASAKQGDWRKPYVYNGNALTKYAGMDRKQIRFIQNLWREIDQSIWESPYLSEYGHTGQVSFSFEVDPNGRLIEETFQAQVQDRILKVIAIRAIRQALRNENKEIEFPTETVRIHTLFSWSDYHTCASKKGTRQNYLQFCKYGENKRKSFTPGEKAATYLEALKYGFGAVEEIQKYQREENRRNTEFDPFENLRRDPDWSLGG